MNCNEFFNLVIDLEITINFNFDLYNNFLLKFMSKTIRCVNWDLIIIHLLIKDLENLNPKPFILKYNLYSLANAKINDDKLMDLPKGFSL